MIQVDSADDDDLIEWDMPLILTPPADKRDLIVKLGTPPMDLSMQLMSTTAHIG